MNYINAEFILIEDIFVMHAFDFLKVKGKSV